MQIEMFLRAWDVCERTLWPLTITSPLVIGISEVSIEIVVDLPLPLCPAKG
jgi:hypothetical protein